MQNQNASHPLANAIEQANASLEDVTSAETIDLDQVCRDHPDVVNDPDRLRALSNLAVLDTVPEEAFRCIVDVVRRTFGVQVARIHLLDDARQWIHTDTGSAAGGSIPIGESACRYVIRQYRTMVIPDLTTDARFGDHPAVIDGETMRFYAGVPLTTSDGHNIGVMCLLDPTPGEGFRQPALGLLERMAELVIQTMELRADTANAREDLRRAVHEDPVTGLVSRRGLLLRLQRSIADDQGLNSPAAVMELYVGSIDRIEQAYGAATMNQLYRDVAERLSAELLSIVVYDA